MQSTGNLLLGNKEASASKMEKSGWTEFVDPSMMKERDSDVSSIDGLPEAKDEDDIEDLEGNFTDRVMKMCEDIEHMKEAAANVADDLGFTTP
jgi:hypothetical protein